MGQLDAYTLRARAWPFALTASPLIALLAIFLPAELPTAFVALGVTGAIVFLGSQISRYAGKRVQAELWRRWGGEPAVHRLMLSGPRPAGEVAKARDVVSAATGVELPTLDDEESDPDGSQERYSLALRSLRDLTRDKERFHLLLEENIIYGFWRNLFGLRPLGLAAAAVAFVASAGLILWCAGEAGRLAWIPGLWAVMAGGLSWLLSDSWVRRAAEEYSERLIGAAELLARGE